MFGESLPTICHNLSITRGILCCSRLELPAGGPAPGGVRAANLTEATRPYLEEVALNEQVIAAYVFLCVKPVCGSVLSLIRLLSIEKGVLCSSVVGVS